MAGEDAKPVVSDANSAGGIGQRCFEIMEYLEGFAVAAMGLLTVRLITCHIGIITAVK